MRKLRFALLMTLLMTLMLSTMAATQTIATVAGGVPLPGATYTATKISIRNLSAVTGDAAGNLYIADAGANNQPALSAIFKLTPDGKLSFYAGTTLPGYSGDGKAATAAKLGLTTVYGMAVDGAGNLYVPDNGNCVVRKVTAATGVITTVAGTGTCGASGDGGAATAAQLKNPAAVAVDGSGNLYIADTGNSVVRRVDASTGVITRVLGTGARVGAGAAGSAATYGIADPYNLALDGSGNLYVEDTGNRVVIRVDAKSGQAAIVVGQVPVAGVAVCAGAKDAGGDGCGATQILISQITPAFAVSAAGDVYFGDGPVVREAPAGGGAVVRVAGGGSRLGDGGPALSAQFVFPFSLFLDAQGNLAVADMNDGRLRWISGGVVSTRAGNGFGGYSGDGGPALSGQMLTAAEAVDGAGNLYVTDSGAIRKITSPGAGASSTITTIAGNGIAGALAGDGGPAVKATLSQPLGIGVTATGDVIFADEDTNAIRKISAATGIISTLAGGASAVGFAGDGGPATAAKISTPTYLTLDSIGDIYFVDFGNNRVREISTDGVMHTVMGSGVVGAGGDGGPATAAELSGDLGGVALDGQNNLYIADRGNHAIREMVRATGAMRTVVSNTPGGTAVSRPDGLAVDGAGNLFYTDTKLGEVLELAKGATQPTVLSGNGTQEGSQFAGAAADASFCLPAGMTGDAHGNIFFTDLCTSTVREIKTQAAVGLAPASVDFGNVELGKTAAAQAVTLNNHGGVALAIAGISISGESAGDFAETNDCGASLEAGASCTVQVTFTPSAVGGRIGKLTVQDNGFDSPQTVGLTGFGHAQPKIALSTTALSFASQAVGTASPAQTVIVSNSGSGSASLSSIAVTGDFSETNACGSSLAVGASCTVSVVFQPTAEGGLVGGLSINDDALGSPQQVSLSGSGIAAGVGLDPAALDFGGVPVNTTSAPLHFTISNTGGAPLQVASITASDGFATTGSCGVVPAGASCSLGVTFHPTAANRVSGVLTIKDNASGGTQQVPLTGLGTAAGALLVSAHVNFAAQPVGSTSYGQLVRLFNTGSLALTGISIPAQVGDFLVTAGSDACGASLAANASCSFLVSFRPSVAGAESATLAITDSLGMQAVALTGVGQPLGVALSDLRVTFGSQTVGTVSAAQTVTLTNTNAAAVNVSSVVSSNPPFGETDNCVGTLAAGKSCSINISFTPTATGPESGVITVTDSTANSPETIRVAGQGAQALQLSPASLDFGGQEVGGASPQQTVSLTNAGVTALTLARTGTEGDFTLTQNLCAGATLAPGGSCQMFVAFAPSAAGASQGSLAIALAGNTEIASAALAGQGTRPGIAAEPARVAFGSAGVGKASGNQTVTIRNTGTAALMLQGLVLQGDFINAGSTCLGAGGAAQALAPGGNCVVNLAMVASSAGTRTGTLLVSNDANGVLAVALAGSGTGSGIELEPSQLSFGSLPVAGAAGQVAVGGQAQIVTVTNRGGSDVALGSISVPGGFAQSNTCGATLGSKASCTISVTFAPLALGQWTGNLTLEVGTGAGAVQTVALSGVGSPQGLTLSPPTLSFGGIGVGQTSSAQTATLSNGTGGDITGLALGASGEFGQTNTCGTTLAAGASCTLKVSVTPAIVGRITGSLTISGTISGHAGVVKGRPAAVRSALVRATAATAASNIAQVAMVSNGNPAGLAVAPASLSFGSQAVGTSSAAQAVTVTNSGSNAAVTNLAVAATPDFDVTTDCGASLAAGASCKINVVFRPTAAGARAGALAIRADGGLQSSVGVSGTATGGTISVAPGALQFGARPQGTLSDAQTVTVKNSGDASIQVKSLAVSNADFAVATSSCGTLPAALAAGASCTVAVTFQPSTAEAESGTLTIGSDATNGNALVGLQGSGSSQGLSLAPARLDFGNQNLGVASTATTVTITNPGSDAVAITAMAASGDYSETNNCGTSLAAGASCKAVVIFTPSAAGSRAGALAVTNGAGVQSVVLSGKGAMYTLAPDATTARVGAGDTASFTISLAPGGFVGNVGLTCDNAAPAVACAVSPASVALAAGAGSAKVTVTVGTKARAGMVLPPAPPAGPSSAWWLVLVGTLLLAMGMGARRTWRRGGWLGVALGAALLTAGCGGVIPQFTSPGGTPAGPYLVTINATSGAAKKSVVLTVMVN